MARHLRSNHNLSRRQFGRLAAALGISGLAGTGIAGCATSKSPVGPATEPLDFIITRWRADPFALGSYSFLAKDATPQHRRDLAKPENSRVYFAGEATESDFPATVHGALLSGQRAARQVLDAGHRSAIVIGAGVSGLAATQQLTAAGCTPHIIEARDRIGGRVWTDTRLGLPLDLGASWIHGIDDNPITEIADRIGVRRVATDYDHFRVRNAKGRILAENELSDDFTSIVAIENEYAAGVDELSPLAVDEGEEFDGDDVVFPDGYVAIVKDLAKSLDVSLNTQVTKITTEADQVVIETTRGVRQADCVVVTVPLGVLKAGTIVFDPPLEAKRCEAIERLGMGLLNKIYLKFETVFWDARYDVLGYAGPKRRLLSLLAEYRQIHG